LPTNPYEPLSGSDVLDDVQPPDQFASAANRSDGDETATTGAETLPPSQIIEAQGWHIDEQGKILLVADAMPIAQASCQIH
jgi:large exoprotein involved in heme utilization and adhesion